MSRWFRHYAGLCRDEKLVSVAIKSRQPVERVVWIWAAILESAAEIDDNGRYCLDAAEVAYFLRTDESDVLAVENALEASGRVAASAVVKWGNRQFSSDRSKARVAAHRERKRAERVGVDVSEPSQNSDVTLQERHGNSPETELETDTEPTVSNEPVGARAKARRPEHALIMDCLTSVLSEDRAKAVVEHRRKMKKPLGLHAAKLLVEQFRQLSEPDRAADLMLLRGWQGCEPDWCVKAGLKLSTACTATPAQHDRIFVQRDTDEWFARVAAGHKPGLSKFYPEHQAEGWLFPAQVHH